MVLDKIKSKTTWSDASASLNENFARILKGIREGIPTIETPVDEQMSDESENAVQNKVIKKYVDDEAVHLEGYAEELVNHLEDDIKTNPSQYVKLKTINGKSLYGTGNIEIEGGGGTGTGLQYAIERTVYPTRMEMEGLEPTEAEITEEERAYNRETAEMAINGQPVFISVEGLFLSLVFTSLGVEDGYKYAEFSSVTYSESFMSAMYSYVLIVDINGDARVSIKPIQTGGSSATPSDMNSDFNNDF